MVASAFLYAHEMDRKRTLLQFDSNQYRSAKKFCGPSCRKIPVGPIVPRKECKCTVVAIAQIDTCFCTACSDASQPRTISIGAAAARNQGSRQISRCSRSCPQSVPKSATADDMDHMVTAATVLDRRIMRRVSQSTFSHATYLTNSTLTNYCPTLSPVAIEPWLERH